MSPTQDFGADWVVVSPHLPWEQGAPGRSGEDNRLFINAVSWRAKTGAPERDLPERFGIWNRVFRRFSSGSKKGIWQEVLEALGDEEPEELMLDSSIVRMFRQAAAAKKKGSTKPWADCKEAFAKKSTPTSMETVLPFKRD